MKKTRWILALMLMVCLLPTMALAKTYKAWNVYNGDVDMTGVTLTKGDKLAKSSGVSVEIHYKDANGNEVADGGETVKTITIDGEKVSEWVITSRYGSYIQIGSMVRGAVGFDLSPAYIAADADGYYTISARTYDIYKDAEKVEERLVKATATYVAATDDAQIASVADGMCVALLDAGSFAAGDRIIFKGTVNGTVEYEGNAIPAIACTEASVQLYDPLQKGDKGESVTEMKLRMQELGYFNAGSSLSDEYNDTCVERVKQFQKKNGLEATGAADVETLTVLFSDAAVAK